ncbi:hypothetical protein ACFX14_033979 [Malus domestica]
MRISNRRLSKIWRRLKEKMMRNRRTVRKCPNEHQHLQRPLESPSAPCALRTPWRRWIWGCSVVQSQRITVLAVASTNRKHRRRCAFAAINALQPVMYVGDSFQDMAMILASFYHYTNFFEPLQHVQATQVCKENMALKLTTAVAPL